MHQTQRSTQFLFIFLLFLTVPMRQLQAMQLKGIEKVLQRLSHEDKSWSHIGYFLLGGCVAGGLLMVINNQKNKAVKDDSLEELLIPEDYIYDDSEGRSLLARECDNVLPIEIESLINMWRNIDRGVAKGDPLYENFYNTVLFQGTSQVGKTMFAQIILEQLGFDSVVVNFSKVLYPLASAARQLESVFQNAEEFTRPSAELKKRILLFDFLNVYCDKRVMHPRDEAGRAYNDLLDAFVRCMERIRFNRNIFVIGVTDLFEHLDLQAVASFTKVVNFKLPNYEQRKQILYTAIKTYSRSTIKMKVTKAFLNTLAERTKGLNCIDLKRIINHAYNSGIHERINFLEKSNPSLISEASGSKRQDLGRIDIEEKHILKELENVLELSRRRQKAHK